MNKGRIETLSDGMFAIVMTLLILEIHIPEELVAHDSASLIFGLAPLIPVLLVYAFTFFILAVFWINHHFIFHAFAKNTDRVFNLLNMAYLLFLAFIPFSAELLAKYHDIPLASMICGANILVVALFSRGMATYTFNRPALRNPDVSERLKNQALFRSNITVVCYVIGIAVALVSPLASFVLYLIPLVFNFVPGTLDALERAFGPLF